MEVFEWYGCHYYYALHLHCTVPRAMTVLYCTCSDLQFMFIPLAIVQSSGLDPFLPTFKFNDHFHIVNLLR